VDVELIPIRRALLSVTDKAGLPELARALADRGITLLSTGGTAAALRSAGLAVVDVAEVTGSPEMFDGRVKTLHPRVHGGILADRDRAGHREDLERHGIDPIDLVIVNLYAFEATTARPGITDAEAIEAIDVGGPTMIRAAAKNHRHVVVVTDPAQYGELLAALAAHHGAVPRELSREFARRAFARTAAYDAAIAAYFAGDGGATDTIERAALALEVVSPLRYGDNPHQPAALLRAPGGTGPDLTRARQLHGKEMSYTNWLDLDRAVRLLAEFDAPAATVIKHASPCGVGFGATLDAACRRAWAGDPLSAFGGIVGLNRRCDAATAAGLAENFVELVAAPGFDDDALALLAKKKNIRLLDTTPVGGRPLPGEQLLRPILGGFLRQAADPVGFDGEMTVVTKRRPTDAEAAALRAAWLIVKHVHSNAIVLADATGSVGLGGGHTSRVDAVDDAIRKSARGVGIGPGTVLASDAFFPFRDSIDAARAAGIAAVVQPGGSLRDAEVIAAADEHGMAMLFTGRRAFLH
jgi:phosphoribosylaminoimidazolecarboxamide formyltransferase/IMP cyclohydrolase